MLLRLTLLLVIYFYLGIHGKWSFLSGNESIGTNSDYTMPYPGGIFDHTMVIDSSNTFVYVFGGSGVGGSTCTIYYYI